MPHNLPPVDTSLTRRRLLQGTLGGAAGLVAWHQGWSRLHSAAAQKNAPSGQMTWAIHVTLAPSWLDPSETLALATPYMLLYALHDALLKPMPDNSMSPSLATRWSESEDGRTYDFELRQGVKFHNGDPFTAEDVQFSFERYKGASAGELKQKVKAVEIVNAHHVRFRLHEPWPDFTTFYGTMATGVGWIVPRHYIEKSGNDAFKNHPVGLGPYRLASHQPGIEVVLEANTDYWRKTPHVKRLVMKSVPEAITRLAMLKKQEADVAYGIFGTLAEDVRRDPNLKLEVLRGQATQWVSFIDQYDPKSPWSDARVRLAANHAVNWPAINEAENLGLASLTGSLIPHKFAYALQLEPYGYDPRKAQQLLKDAGYASGFDAGECSTDTPYATVIEAVVNDLTAVGIRTRVRPMERAARGREAGQEIDYTHFFGSIAKWVTAVHDPHRVPAVLTRAFHMARSGRPGPVVVSLPRDMLDETADMPLVEPYPVIRANPEPALIREMMQRLGAARTPIILAGSGTEYAGARQELIAFSEKFQVPVVTTYRRLAAFPNDHAYYLGNLSSARNHTRDAVAGADLVLAIGTRLNQQTTAGWTLPHPDQALIQIDPAEEVIGQNHRPTIGMVSDIKLALAAG